MENNCIWAFYSMKKGTLDNNYYFYDDGKILHEYDQSQNKLNMEQFILPSEISPREKKKILSQCKLECNSDVYEKIELILNYE